MAKKEKEVTEDVIHVTPKQGDFDITERVEQTATAKHPFRNKGEKLRVSKISAEKNKANGWAE